ncbi:MAG TPA: hypothetical protein VFQ88_07915 [Nevskiaceae bacterium]|nr:hypothetical protein [Nevskiaceae bacterium]
MKKLVLVVAGAAFSLGVAHAAAVSAQANVQSPALAGAAHFAVLGVAGAT